MRMENIKKNFTLMAVSTGRASREAGNIARYIGVGSVRVLAVNPTKAQLEELLNITLEKDPVYVGEQEQDGGKKVRYARLEFVLQAVPENNDGIDAISRMSLFIRETVRANRDGSKLQVIDKYGRTAWVTVDEFKAKEIPTYRNGKKANIDADYRACYQGEEDVTKFFQAYLNIPSPMSYKDGEWVMGDNLDECLARFDHVKEAFSGKFDEFREALKYQPDNKVKVLFGIRTSADGRQYQDFYTRMFLRNGASNYDRLAADMQSSKENGGYPNTEFEVAPLHEYKVESTNLDVNAQKENDPFGVDNSSFFN